VSRKPQRRGKRKITTVLPQPEAGSLKKRGKGSVYTKEGPEHFIGTGVDSKQTLGYALRPRTRLRRELKKPPAKASILHQQGSTKKLETYRDRKKKKEKNENF